MGAGRKTSTFYASSYQDMTNYSSSMRNLNKVHLGGVVFGCKDITIKECLSKQLFGLPAPHFVYVKNISPGLPLFLFNYSDRKLHGIYEAASHGQMNINPYGWTIDGSERTQFPAQVQIHVKLQCQPLPENLFKEIIADNYYTQYHFWFELDHAQTSKLVSKFASAVVPSTSVPRKMKWRTTFQALPSRGTIEEPEGPEPLNSKADHLNKSSLNLDSNLSFESYDSSKSQLDVKEAEIEEQELIYMKLKELALQCNLKSEGQDMPMSGNIEVCAVLNEMTSEDNKNQRQQLGLQEKRAESSRSMFEDKIGESPQSLSEHQEIIPKLIREVEELKAFKAEQSKKIGYLENKLEQAEMEIVRLKDCIKLEPESTPSMEDIDEKVMLTSDTSHLDPYESMYLVGGFDSVSWLLSLDAYYPSKDMKKSLKPMSSLRTYTSVAILSSDVYVIGGGHDSEWYDTVESYCPSTDEWKVCSSLREKKGSLAAATANNKIFAMGGGNGIECFGDVEMLDLDIGRWIRTQSMLQKRFSLAAAELNGVLYATGGYDGNGYLNTVERFDPREHSWTKMAPMISVRGCHSLVALNEKLYAIGGFDGSRMVASVETLDPRMGSWMLGEPLHYARGYSAAAVVKDAIYVMGGVRAGDTVANTVECYKEGQGWQETVPKAIGNRCFMAAVAYST